MIREIELINFRSHKNTKLKFTEGNNILVGISGSGKSSVLDAICFALFGTITKIQKKKIKLNDLIMNKPFKEESSKIKLTFTLNGKNYEIIRKFYLDKPSHAELREDNKLIAVGPLQVTTAIEHLLKVNYDLFSKVIYAEQNQIDYFLNLPPGNRMNAIDELLKLSKFEDIRAKSISYSNKFRNLEISRKEAISSINEDELKNKKKCLEEELDKLKKERKKLEDEIEKVNKVIDENEKTYLELKEKKEKLEALKENLTKIRTKISVFENEISKVEPYDFEKLESEFQSKREEFERLERKNLNLEKRISEISSKIEELERNLKEKKEMEAFLEKFDLKSLEKLKEKFEKLEKQFLEKNLMKENLEDVIEKLEKVKEKCPICNSILSDHKRKKLIEDRKSELIKLKNELSELEENLNKIKKSIEYEEINFDRAKFFEKRLKQLSNIEENLEKLNKELSKTKSEKVDISKIKEELEELKKLYEKAKEIEEKKKELESYREEEKNLKKKLDKIYFDENLLEKIREELEKFRSNKIQLSKDLELNLEIANEKEKFYNQILKDLEFFEKNKEEIEFLSYASMTLKKLSEVLVEIQENLRQEFVRNLNEVMNEIWSNIYPYEDYIGIRFKIEDRDYLLQLCDLKNRWVNVEGFSSGGERAIASLVMRIALSIILAPKLRILILDEPTHNLDANTIEKLIEILRTKISDLIEQVFIVTHDERLVEAGTGYIYEFLREQAKKEPTTYREIERI
jgi:exonuclease SbcC